MDVRRKAVGAGVAVLVGLGAVLSPAPALSATFRVGMGGGCTHSTIQAAVDAAAVSPGFDYVRITRSQNYLDQSVRIHGQDLILEGGFANCQSPTPDSGRAAVSGAGPLRRSVFTIGEGTVSLADLVIVSGDPQGDGGGILVNNRSTKPTTLRLFNVHVEQNTASRGGGISVQGRWDPVTNVRLVLANDTVVKGNHAFADGGGIHCRDATVEISGARSLVNANRARRGGGLHAEGCRVMVSSAGNHPFYGAIAFNIADENGGGISVEGQYTNTRIITMDAKLPAAITYNMAGRHGGGIYVHDAHVDVVEAIVHGNVANDSGGGAFVEADEDVLFSSLNFMPASRGDGATCDEALQCNRLSGNRAGNPDRNEGDGAGVMLRALVDEKEAHTTLRLLRTRVSDNVGATVIDQGALTTGFGDAVNTLTIHAAVFTGNHAGRALIEHYSNWHPGWWALFTMRETSIAGNKIKGKAVISSFDPADIKRSIVWQPGTPAFVTGGSTPSTAEYVIASDFAGIAITPDLLIADPVFQDETAGDLHLRYESPAIDYAPDDGLGLTHDGKPRPVDLPSIPDRFGPEDIGGYEVQTDPGSILRQ